MRYGKLVDGSIEFAKESRQIDGNFYTKLTKAQHLSLGEKPVYEVPPLSAASAGFHWELDGWKEQDAGIISIWKLVEDPPTVQTIKISKTKVEAVIDRMNLTNAFMAWLQSKASYFGGWMRAGDVIEYDPMDNASDLANLLETLQIPSENVAALIEEVRV